MTKDLPCLLGNVIAECAYGTMIWIKVNSLFQKDVLGVLTKFGDDRTKSHCTMGYFSCNNKPNPCSISLEMRLLSGCMAQSCGTKLTTSC
jgi:hypothetical protein